jgi:hypothetical protein
MTVTPRTRFHTSSPTSRALRRLGAGAGTARVPCPADLVRAAADEIDALRDALFWCGGSPSFGPGGEAEEGWRKLAESLL